MEIREGWRSIILDACDLRDLGSHGDEVRSMKFVFIDSLILPSDEETSPLQPEPRPSPQS